MAAVAPSSDQAAELLHNLSLDSSQSKALKIPDSTDKMSVYQYGAVDSAIPASGGQNHPPKQQRSVTPYTPDAIDPTLCYYSGGYPSPAFFYGGYNGTGSDGYSRYGNTDGVDMTGAYGENGSIMYHNGYGYAPYGPYSPATSPVPTLGNDSQLYGPQHYQYAPYFSPLTPTSAPFTPSQTPASQVELSTSSTDQKHLPVDTLKGNSSAVPNGGGIKGNNGSAPHKPAYQNSSLHYNNSYGACSLPGSYQDPRFGYDGQYKSAGINSSYSKANSCGSRNYNYRQTPNAMGLNHPGAMSMGSTHGYVNRMFPNKFFGPYGSTFRSGMGFGSGYDSRLNGWFAADGKYKPKGRGNGYLGYRNDNIDGLNELNKGPRAKVFRNQKDYVPVTVDIKGEDVPANETTGEEKDEMSSIPDREQYNKVDFAEEFADAKIFIIKSYSEDDVHKSIKYNVWASTPNGNKKLDAAYREAQQKSGDCPVFLFFSVNMSGQFVGLAEMIGPVDFKKNVEYWQQDKWTGCFPVKWHIVKDVPNNLLKHITLENNENKPVTNSRDTQDVKLEQGIQMIKIFKGHSSKTCILDDFEFYEKRQGIVQEKKAKQQQFQKQVLEGKLTDERKEVSNGSPQLPEVVSEVVVKPTSTVQSNGEVKHSENGSVAKVGDASAATTRPVASDEKIVANGTATGC